MEMPRINGFGLCMDVYRYYFEWNSCKRELLSTVEYIN